VIGQDSLSLYEYQCYGATFTREFVAFLAYRLPLSRRCLLPCSIYQLPQPLT
jgi:hypothetical protein